MSGTNLRILGLHLILAAFLTLFVSCGGGKPSTVSRPVTGTGLTTVSLGNDVTVRVPAGALPDGATVNVVKASGKDAAPGELEGGKSVGSAFKIDVDDQKLSKPVTIEIAFDPKSLPKDMPKEAVFLAHYDEEKQQWIPVGGQVDVNRNVVSIETDHLSWWNPFSWNWEAWIAVMKKGLSGKLTDWVEGVQLLTTECKKSGQSVSIDDSKANNVIQGCVTKDDPSKPELRVVNLKSFYLGISPAPGGPGYPQATLLGPGDAVSFTASTADTPPATVNADFTDAAMWRFVVGLVARMIPGGDLIPNDGLAFIAEGLKSDMAAFEAGEKLDAGDSLGGAESIYELITGDSFIESFVRLATEYGQKSDVEMMTKWTQEGLSAVFLGAASVDVIISATDFLANYVLNNHSAVSFSWNLPTLPASAGAFSTVAPGDISGDPGQVGIAVCIAQLQWAGLRDIGGGVMQEDTSGPLSMGYTEVQARDFLAGAVDYFGVSASDRSYYGIQWKGEVTVHFLRRAFRPSEGWSPWMEDSEVIRLRKLPERWEWTEYRGTDPNWYPLDTPNADHKGCGLLQQIPCPAGGCR